MSPTPMVAPPHDASGLPLAVGDTVESTPAYAQQRVSGTVVRIEKGLVVVRHTSGSRIGQEWRATGWLWRRT